MPFVKNFMFSLQGIIWSIFIHGRSTAIHVITLIILCRCLQESFRPWTQRCSESLQIATRCCIAWIHLWIIFQEIWTKQSIFMLIYWPSMKRNALQALWLILHQAQWSGKDCDSDSGVDRTWDTGDKWIRRIRQDTRYNRKGGTPNGWPTCLDGFIVALLINDLPAIFRFDKGYSSSTLFVIDNSRHIAFIAFIRYFYAVMLFDWF